MIIDCISDLHGHYPKLEGGDLLIVAGDLTARDTKNEYVKFTEWFLSQDYKKKIVVPGNHDTCIEKGDYYFNHDWLGYLCDSGTEFEGLKIWGSPWTTDFPGINPKCCAFTVSTDAQLRKKWNLIPDDIDIIVTHSPPYGIFDETERDELVGSRSLLLKVAQIKPLIHCFGHIHEKGGKELWVPWKNGTRFINASHVNERYQPVNKPVRIDI